MITEVLYYCIIVLLYYCIPLITLIVFYIIGSGFRADFFVFFIGTRIYNKEENREMLKAFYSVFKQANASHKELKLTKQRFTVAISLFYFGKIFSSTKLFDFLRTFLIQ